MVLPLRYRTERSRVLGPTSTNDHCRVGLLDANVIIATLEQHSLHCTWLDNRKFSGAFRAVPAVCCCAPLNVPFNSAFPSCRADGTRICVDRLVGIIVNRAGLFGLHWFAIRRIGDRIYNLDSKLSRPRPYKSVDEVGTATHNVACDERCPPHCGTRIVPCLDLQLHRELRHLVTARRGHLLLVTDEAVSVDELLESVPAESQPAET